MNKTFMRRICMLALCLALALSPAQAISLPGFGSGIKTSAFEDDGVIRVYLKSLAGKENLTLSLDGVYTVENDPGFRFDRGSRIVLSAGESGVWLSAGGMKIDMGYGLTLTRHASDGMENGIRIAETDRENLYCGDLSVSLEDGKLRTVISMHIEDYLLGVVAYEMSDSWPIEALKSQAVAARTYAMQRKMSAGTKDYDLVDTTADQVFKGCNPEYTNVALAVQETAGVVGTYKGSFATCYYTASNGGQTALPADVWGMDGDYGYLDRTADPYDLENSYSMVSSASFALDAKDNPALHDMLTDGLMAAAQQAGVSADGLELGSILSIEPADPAADGSIMYRKLRFQVSALADAPVYAPAADDIGAPAAQTGNANADAALSSIDMLRRLVKGSPYVQGVEKRRLDQTFTIDLDVYTDIKHGLGLSINSADCEIVSVTGDVFSYTIEMRRYGHGVGMSQRGAQRMAGGHKKTWRDIIAFYYPGMTLEKIEWNRPEMTAIEALPESIGAARPAPTPTPTPAPLPPLEDGQRYAAVTLGDVSTSMNVRQGPSTQTPVVTQLSNGRRVIICSDADENGWVQIKTAEISGYAKLEYLKEE